MLYYGLCSVLIQCRVQWLSKLRLFHHGMTWFEDCSSHVWFPEGIPLISPYMCCLNRIKPPWNPMKSPVCKEIFASDPTPTPSPWGPPLVVSTHDGHIGRCTGRSVTGIGAVAATVPVPNPSSAEAKPQAKWFWIAMNGNINYSWDILIGDISSCYISWEYHGNINSGWCSSWGYHHEDRNQQ